GVCLIVFLTMRVLPGDVVDAIAGGDGTSLTPEKRAQIEEQLGLQKPLASQFSDWVKGLVLLDFGRSLRTGKPIADDLKARLPRTRELAVLAVFVATSLGVLRGLVSAATRGSPVDYLLRMASLLGLAVPLFFFQSAVRNFLLPRYFGWLPPPGYSEL